VTEDLTSGYEVVACLRACWHLLFIAAGLFAGILNIKIFFRSSTSTVCMQLHKTPHIIIALFGLLVFDRSACRSLSSSIRGLGSERGGG